MADGAQMGIKSGQVESRLHFQLFWGPFRSFLQPERPLERLKYQLLIYFVEYRWAEGLPVDGNVHHLSFSIRPANDSCKG